MGQSGRRMLHNMFLIFALIDLTSADIQANNLCFLSVGKWLHMDSLRVQIQRTGFQPGGHPFINEVVVFDSRATYTKFAEPVIVYHGDQLIFLGKSGQKNNDETLWQGTHHVLPREDSVNSPSHVESIDTLTLTEVDGVDHKSAKTITYKLVLLLTQVHMHSTWNFLVLQYVFPAIGEDPEQAQGREIKWKYKVQDAYRLGWKKYRLRYQRPRWVIVFADKLARKGRLPIEFPGGKRDQAVDAQVSAAFFSIRVETNELPAKIHFGDEETWKNIEIKENKQFYRNSECKASAKGEDAGKFYLVVFKKFRDFNRYWRTVQEERVLHQNESRTHKYWNDEKEEWLPDALDELIPIVQREAKENLAKAKKRGEWYFSTSSEGASKGRGTKVVITIIIIFAVSGLIVLFFWWNSRKQANGESDDDSKSRHDNENNETELKNLATKSSGNDKSQDSKNSNKSADSEYSKESYSRDEQNVPAINFATDWPMESMEEALFGDKKKSEDELGEAQKFTNATEFGINSFQARPSPVMDSVIECDNTRSTIIRGNRSDRSTGTVPQAKTDKTDDRRRTVDEIYNWANM